MNGVITYTGGPADSRPVNTIATYTCDNGYTLTGGSFRQCQNDSTWSGTAPTCQGEFHYILAIASPFLIQWTQDPLNHPPPVLTSLYQPIEWSATIWGLLVWDQWILWPPTPVTLATFSMEVPPGLVGVMECGVGQLQLVSVSGLDFVYCLFVECIVSHTANCPDLPSLTNGMIMYSAGSTNNRPFISTAVYSCNTGYTLNGGTLSGGTTRVCVGEGRWSGSPPTCQQRKENWICTVRLLMYMYFC